MKLTLKITAKKKTRNLSLLNEILYFFRFGGFYITKKGLSD